MEISISSFSEKLIQRIRNVSGKYSFYRQCKNSKGRTFYFVCNAFSESALLRQVTLIQGIIQKPCQKSQDISKYLSPCSSISLYFKTATNEDFFPLFQWDPILSIFRKEQIGKSLKGMEDGFWSGISSKFE